MNECMNQRMREGIMNEERKESTLFCTQTDYKRHFNKLVYSTYSLLKEQCQRIPHKNLIKIVPQKRLDTIDITTLTNFQTAIFF